MVNFTRLKKKNFEELSEWLNNSSNKKNFLKIPIKDLQKQSGEIHPGVLSNRIGSLRDWYANQFYVDFYSEKPFQESLSKYLYFNEKKVLLDVKLYEEPDFKKRVRPSFFPSKFICDTLMLCLVNADYDMLYETTKKYYEDKKFFLLDFGEDFPFEYFALFLLAQARNDTELIKKLKKKDFGIYKDIVKEWEKDITEEQINKICDYHVSQFNKWRRYDSEIEFEWAPYTFFPVEVLALFKVRQKLGLNCPEVSHELLDLPANISDKFTPVEDELVEIRVSEILKNS